MADSSFRKMALQRDGEITGTEPKNGHSEKTAIAMSRREIMDERAVVMDGKVRVRWRNI